MTQTTATVTPLRSNVPDFNYYREEAKKYGADRASGDDAQVRFDRILVDGAYHGTLTLDPDKHGKGRSDAVVLTEDYVNTRAGKSVFNIKNNGNKKTASNSKKFLEIGAFPWPRSGGTITAYFDGFVEYWRKVRALDPDALKTIPAGRSPKDLDDVHNALTRLFTALKKNNGQLLPEDERNAYAFKTAKAAKTETEMLEDARKLLTKSNDASPQIKAAKDAITLRLANIAKGQR